LKSNKTYIRALIASVTAGIVAVSLAAIFIKQSDSKKIMKIVIASKVITPGDFLTNENIRLEDWNGGDLPSSAEFNLTPLISRKSNEMILVGDVIKESLLLKVGANGTLASNITKGKRAYSLRISEEDGVAGFILPGNHVDIYSILKDSKGLSISKVLLENILVLGIAQDSLKTNRMEPRVVNVITFEVFPAEVEKINTAHFNGNLTLVLRNQFDKLSEFNNKILDIDEPLITSTQFNKKIILPIKKTAQKNPIEVLRGTAMNKE